MYDPNRKGTLSDGGCWCPGCKVNLLLVTCDSGTRPHPSGDGLAWDCPKCGEALHENDFNYVFPDDETKEPVARVVADLLFEIRDPINDFDGPCRLVEGTRPLS